MNTRGILLVSLIVALATVGVGYAILQKSTTVQVNTHELVSNLQPVEVDITTNTQYLDPIMGLPYCQVHSYGQSMKLHFDITNSSAQMGGYFSNVQLTFHVTGSGYSQTCVSQYTGTSIVNGFVTLPASSPSDFTVTVDVAPAALSGGVGSKTIGVGVWGEVGS